MNYKLIALDIDGTLLDKTRNLSTETISTLKAISKDYKIILISSRMPKAMRHLQKELGILNMPLIAYNGGLVLNDDKILNHCGIDFKTFKDVLELNLDLNLHLSLFYNDEWFVPQQDFWSKREEANTKVKPEIKSNQIVFENWKAYNKEPHKIMCMGDEKNVDIFYKRLNLNLKDKLHLYRSKPTYIELAPLQISKLTGIKMLLSKSYPDISLEQVVAYGDNYNDIELLQNVGLGVAVSNAKPEVLAIADENTSSNIEHGVAKHLTKLFDLKF